MVPVGRRKISSEDGKPGEHGDGPEKTGKKPPRFGRLAHFLMLALAAELLIVGGFHAAAQWSKTRGIAVPVTETDRTVIT